MTGRNAVKDVELAEHALELHKKKADLCIHWLPC